MTEAGTLLFYANTVHNMSRCIQRREPRAFLVAQRGVAVTKPENINNTYICRSVRFRKKKQCSAAVLLYNTKENLEWRLMLQKSVLTLLVL